MFLKILEAAVPKMSESQLELMKNKKPTWEEKEKRDQIVLLAEDGSAQQHTRGRERFLPRPLQPKEVEHHCLW